MGAGRRWVRVALITMLVGGALASGSAEAAPLAPSAQITSGPPSSHSSRTATFTFTSDDPLATFQCRLDGASFAACTSPKTYTALAQASHAFEVRAVDVLANTGAPAQWSFAVVGPETMITGGPSGTVSSPSATFTFTGSDTAVGFECSLDWATFRTCSSPATYSSLDAEVTHSFRVRAVGQEGLVDPTPDERTFYIDAPETTITDGPSGSVTSRSSSFSFTGSATAVGFQCSLDGADYSPCASPITYSDLAVGVGHTFQVRAVSADGLVDPTPASRTWGIEPAADLSVQITATPNRVKPNGTLTYVVRVTNLGPDTATDIFSVLELSGGASLLSVSSTEGICGANDDWTVYCQAASLPVGATGTMTVKYKVTAARGLDITALAWTAAAEFDPQEPNSSASVTTRVGK